MTDQTPAIRATRSLSIGGRLTLADLTRLVDEARRQGAPDEARTTPGIGGGMTVEWEPSEEIIDLDAPDAAERLAARRDGQL